MKRNIGFKQLSTCAGFVAFHILAGSLIGFFFPSGDWVNKLVKPDFYPPSMIFPIAWTFLYALMGVSLWLFWSSAKSGKGTGLFWYANQLSVNFLFSPLMFGLQSTLLGLINIIILLPLIGVTMLKFYRGSPKAAYLLIPYLLWVIFALALSFNLWILNP
jgi:tryptophan-rich sensory protein